MKAIICVEDRGGCLFHNRRVSRDRCVTQRILEEEEKVFVSPYSFRLLKDEKCVVDDGYAGMAAETGGTAFFEDPDALMDVIGQVSTLVVYGWNREYPSDKKFTVPDCFEKAEEEEFAGFSHEKITKTIYRRKEPEHEEDVSEM